MERAPSSAPPVTAAARLAAVDQGAWWLFITAQFLHASWFHLGANMYFLYSVGPQLEQIIGALRFGVLYLIAGTAGYALSYWMEPHTHTLGASGALYGVAA